MSKKFIKELNKAYRSVILEQDGMQPGLGGAPAPIGAGPMSPPPAPTPTASPMPAMPSEENPIEDESARSSSDTFLIGLVAKALLVNIDDDDRLKIVKYVKKLNKENASKIEENLVNTINSYDHQILDDELEKDLKLPKNKSRKVLKFLENILQNYTDTGTK